MAPTPSLITPVRRPSVRRRVAWPYRLQLWLMLAPYLAGLGLLILIPALLASAVAFTDFDALRPPRWIGVDNFREMFRDRDFWNGLRASVLFVVLAVPVRVLGALLLALLLYKPGRGVGLLRAAVYVPTIVPTPAYALLWLYIFNPTFGPLNGLLVLFPPVRTELIASTAWLVHPLAAQVAVVIMLAWTIGEGFVLLMAALQDVPAELYESAAIDGAGAWHRFRAISLPMLTPFLLLLTLRDTVLSFQANSVAAMILTEGGPRFATSYLPYWIYLSAVDHQRFGYAAAMTLVLFLVTAAIIDLQFRFARRWGGAYLD